MIPLIISEDVKKETVLSLAIRLSDYGLMMKWNNGLMVESVNPYSLRRKICRVLTKQRIKVAKAAEANHQTTNAPNSR